MMPRQQVCQTQLYLFWVRNVVMAKYHI